jgi:predicted ATPase
VGLTLLIEVGQGFAAEGSVVLKVEVGAVGDPLELAPAHREPGLDVHRAFGVVGKLVLAVLAQAEVVGPDAVALVPAQALGDPALVPVLVGRLPVQPRSEPNTNGRAGNAGPPAPGSP